MNGIHALTPNNADKTFRDICVRACIEALMPLEIIVPAANIKTLDDACALARETAKELSAAGFDIPERVRMFATPEDWATEDEPVSWERPIGEIVMFWQDAA